MNLEKGKIGMKLESLQMVLTLTGRPTTPFVNFKNKNGTIKKNWNQIERMIGQWLVLNAYHEALHKGDAFNTVIFEKTLEQKNFSQSDRDSAESYLFEYQPPIIKSFCSSISKH